LNDGTKGKSQSEVFNCFFILVSRPFEFMESMEETGSTVSVGLLLQTLPSERGSGSSLNNCVDVIRVRRRPTVTLALLRDKYTFRTFGHVLVILSF